MKNGDRDSHLQPNKNLKDSINKLLRVIKSRLLTMELKMMMIKLSFGADIWENPSKELNQII